MATSDAEAALSSFDSSEWTPKLTSACNSKTHARTSVQLLIDTQLQEDQYCCMCYSSTTTAQYGDQSKADAWRPARLLTTLRVSSVRSGWFCMLREVSSPRSSRPFTSCRLFSFLTPAACKHTYSALSSTAMLILPFEQKHRLHRGQCSAMLLMKPAAQYNQGCTPCHPPPPPQVISCWLNHTHYLCL